MFQSGKKNSDQEHMGHMHSSLGLEWNAPKSVEIKVETISLEISSSQGWSVKE